MHLAKHTWLSLIRYGYTENNLPLLPCPSCQKLDLQLVDDSLHCVKQRGKKILSNFKKLAPDAGFVESLLSVAESYTEYTAERYQFVAFYQCTHCHEPVSALGKAKLPKNSGMDPQLSVEFFSPALQLFHLKPIYPSQVRVELEKSFAAFFSDPTAAGSRIRTCVEFLLDEQGVQKHRVGKTGEIALGKDGSQLKLTLGERLKQFSESDPVLGNMLGAVKSLGNEATHGAEMLNEDLWDAYNLIEHVLEEIYVVRPHRTTLLAQSSAMQEKFK